jgi:hypothetical protein
MAYFAKLGTGNIVEKVISINNSVITDDNGVEQEKLGNDFINKLYNTRDVWKQTSYNTISGVHNNNGTPLRKNYAGIGFTYDQQRDAFIPPKPYNSWILNEYTCQWQSPVPYPITNNQNNINEFGNPTNDLYRWNEQNLSWDLVEI